MDNSPYQHYDHENTADAENRSINHPRQLEAVDCLLYLRGINSRINGRIDIVVDRSGRPGRQ